MEVEMVVKILNMIFIILVLISIVSAVETPLDVKSSQEGYVMGENILINATIFNNYDYSVFVLVESMLLNEKGTYPEAIIPFEFELGPRNEKNIIIYNLNVTEDLSSGNYTAYIKLFFNNQMIMDDSVSFVVSGTLKSFDFSIDLNKKVFTRGEDVSLNYTSSIQDPEISAILTNPNNSTEQIDLPYLFSADEIGTYILEVNAFKKGYKDVSVKEQFGVIKENASIKKQKSLNGIGKYKKDQIIEKEYLFYAIGIILIILLIFFIVIFIRKNQK